MLFGGMRPVTGAVGWISVPGQRQVQNLWEVVQQWRLDGLEFLRHDAPRILFIVVVAFVLIRALKAITKRLMQFSRTQALPTGVRSQQLRTLAGVINSVGTAVISFIALLQVLGTLDINMGPLLASAGIAGLAIGFGAQTLVKDVINGFFILMENQYDIGDVIKIAGVSGSVEHMTLRLTALRDADGTLHMVPNSQITVVSNLTRDWAQISMHVAVSYTEDSERVVQLLKEVGQELHHDPGYAEWIVAEPDVPGIERVTSEEVDYLILVKTKPGKQYAVSRELRRRIKLCFEKNDVKPGGPHRFYVMDAGSSGRAS
jgi:small conductance mechanosensitive channel